MTNFGKTLVFLNLILGIGAAVYSTSVYASRPPWFADPETSIDRGNKPLYFKQLAAEIDSQGKAGGFASARWGAELKGLEATEKLRADRHLRMFGTLPDGTRPMNAKGLIDFAKEDGIPNADGGGFLILNADKATGLLNLNPDLSDPKSALVYGPDGKPLKGTGKLLDKFTADNEAAVGFANDSKKLRLETDMLGVQIGTTQTQIQKQRDIRDNLVNEAEYLKAFAINAGLNRATFQARRNQLLERLAPFRAQDKK